MGMAGLELVPHEPKEAGVAVTVKQNEDGESSAGQAGLDRRKNDWHDPKFWVTLALFLITLVSIFWSRAGKEREVDLLVAQSIAKQDDMLKQLVAINEKLGGMALKNNTLEINQESARRETGLVVESLRTEDNKLWQVTREHMAYIEGLRDRISRIEAKTGIK